MMGYPEMGCSVLRYGARQAPPQRGSHQRIPAPTETPACGATARGVDTSSGGEGARAAAVLRHQVRAGRASHRSRGPAAIREALSQTAVVLLAAEATDLEVLSRLREATLVSFYVVLTERAGLLRCRGPGKKDGTVRVPSRSLCTPAPSTRPPEIDRGGGSAPSTRPPEIDRGGGSRPFSLSR